ncbi:MAG: hypothetical protein WBA74_14710 [Cyclobacteriaceae bacterium]
MNLRSLLIAMVGFVGFAACEGTDSNLLSEEEAQQILDVSFPVVGNIAILDTNNEIFYISNLNEEEVAPVVSPNEGKSEVKLTDDGTLIAYLCEEGYPVIIDREGNTVVRYSDHTDVRGFGWANDFRTFYIYSGGEFTFIGEQISLPELTAFEDAFVFPKEILHVSLSQQNDLLYIFQSGFDREEIIYRRAGASEEVGISYTGSKTPVYGKFTINNNLLMGFRSSSIRENFESDFTTVYETIEEGSEQLDFVRDFDESNNVYYRVDTEYFMFVDRSSQLVLLSLNGNEEDYRLTGYTVKSFDWR